VEEEQKLSNQENVNNADDDMVNDSSDGQIIEATDAEKENESIKEFYHILETGLGQSISTSSMGQALYKQVQGGKKTVYSKTIRETKIFEKSFIPVLVDCFKSISKILKDPKKAIRYEEEVVPMEKAKKVNSDTVRHLAAHTQYIKEVKDNGDIVPSKLLTTFSEDELGIYENRFIKTLINRICKFLSLRIQIMKKNLDSYETRSTVITNDFKLEDKTKVKVELSVKMESEQDSEVKMARDTFEKAKDIHEKFKTLRSSQLMQALKNYKEVVPPIQKTNIILKNPEFKICYNTWVFLDRYNQLAFDVNVREKKNKYTDDEATTVDRIVTHSVGTMLYFGVRDFDKEDLYKSHTFRNAKQINKMDDEYKFKPDSQKLEQFEMSEYFLNKTQEFYQQSLEDKVNSGMEKKYSLELVFREMQEVVNSIYPPLFEVPQEDEFEEVPLPVKLERAKKKADVLDTITRLKEVDYNNTKKEYESTLAEIQQTEEKIRQQAAREARLKKLAEEKAARAAKRAQEREGARKLREELEAKSKAERAKLKAEREEARAKEKAEVEATKSKLQERRARILAEQEARKAERRKEREEKIKAKELAKANAEAEAKKVEEQEKELEASKAHLDAKEILRRRREIIKAKASAARAKEEALKAEAMDAEADDDTEENEEVKAIDNELDQLLNDFNVDEADEPEEETLSPKELLRRRREAIRQKALADKAGAMVIDEDEEDEKVVDNKTLFENRRKERQEENMMDSSDVVSAEDNDEEEKPTASPQIPGRAPASLFERNRDIIRRRAILAQRQAEAKNMADAQNNVSEAPTPSQEEDPREVLRRRREAMKQKALEQQSSMATKPQENTVTSEKVDPRELLRRRREAIRAKALAAKAKENDED
jgi:DNA repair protein SbcC/Rad50